MSHAHGGARIVSWAPGGRFNLTSKSGAQEAFMRTHHPWWPYIDLDPIFNPFIAVTVRRRASDRIELTGTEQEAGDEKTRRRPDDSSFTDE